MPALENSSPTALSRLSLFALFVLGLISSSYLTTETFDFGGKADPAIDYFKQLYSEYYPAEELVLTSIQLRYYDGSDPTLPVYLAISGRIYDVTAGKHNYAPGGSYSFFSGRDASRSYITGCFQTHLTHDLRGIDDDQLPSLHHWESFFAKSKKYFYVGRLILDPIDPNSPIPEPC